MKPYSETLAKEFRKMKYDVIRKMVSMAVEETGEPVSEYRKAKIRQAIIHYHFD